MRSTAQEVGRGLVDGGERGGEDPRVPGGEPLGHDPVLEAALDGGEGHGVTEELLERRISGGGRAGSGSGSSR
ncbi:MAG: hypothetical protein M5U14_12910 [Acidimicrobiia bacterium]|nr:hypothetical protein [Acidimicrobiia bacterium]